MIDFTQIQRYWARTSVGASTVRGQPKGTMKIARNYLSKINLTDFSRISSEKQFKQMLNEKTIKLQNIIPSQSWGISRKVLNIFLIKVSHDKYLSKEHKLDAILDYLEVPLDNKNVKEKIIKHVRKRGDTLPTWTTIKELNQEKSDIYQSYSNKIAKEKGCKRYQLDFHWWSQQR